MMMSAAGCGRAGRVASPMPGLPPNTTTVYAAGSGSRWPETGVVALVWFPPLDVHRDRLAAWAAVGRAGGGMSAICMRSAVSAAL
jgi:hypothetical protein